MIKRGILYWCSGFDVPNTSTCLTIPKGNTVYTINYSNDSYIEGVLNDFTSEEREELLRLFSKLTCNMVDMRLENTEE